MNYLVTREEMGNDRNCNYFKVFEVPFLFM